MIILSCVRPDIRVFDVDNTTMMLQLSWTTMEQDRDTCTAVESDEVVDENRVDGVNGHGGQGRTTKSRTGDEYGKTTRTFRHRRSWLETWTTSRWAHGLSCTEQNKRVDGALDRPKKNFRTSWRLVNDDERWRPVPVRWRRDRPFTGGGGEVYKGRLCGASTTHSRMVNVATRGVWATSREI